MCARARRFARIQPRKGERCRRGAAECPSMMLIEVVLPAPFGPQQGDDLAGVDGEAEHCPRACNLNETLGHRP